MVPFIATSCSYCIVQWDSYAYADKKRETQRLEALAESKTAEAKERRAREKKKRAEQKQKNAAWSKEVERKTAKEKRKEKKARKRDWVKSQRANEKCTAETRPTAGGKRTEPCSDDGDDWDELAREERMAKKVRKGTLDSKAFDEEFTGL